MSFGAHLKFLPYSHCAVLIVTNASDPGMQHVHLR